MNYAKDRIENEFGATFPSKDIVCNNCKYRLPGILGARNSYCQKYPRPQGKLNRILFRDMFQNESNECEYYAHE